VLASHPDDRFGLRPHHEAELRTLAERDVELLSRSGCAVVGTLDDLVPPPGEPRPHPDDVPDAEIVPVAAQAIEQMIRDVQRLSARSRRRSRPGQSASLGTRLLGRLRPGRRGHR
jgi:hypothetical protein